MKKLIFAIFISSASIAVYGCSDGKNTGIPNSGVIPQEIERNGDGSLIKDTEKLPMTGQWCSEIDHKYRRIGSPSNCVIDY
ncbi:hypothetical protein CSP48_004509 [Salmonella enterica subsp. arizonae]|nr:hypothetical protein [Salmonella enterica subsp. arizonae]